jgi:outer membrane protein TolC
VAAAEAALRQARADHAPRVTGAAGYGYGGEDTPLKQNYSLALLLNVPVFNGYLTTEQVREEQARLLSAKYGLDALSRQVRLQVEQTALILRDSWDQIDVRRSQVGAARENLQLATGRYEAGAGDIIEMTDAQLQADQAETALVEAFFDYNAAVATLRRAIGQ